MALSPFPIDPALTAIAIAYKNEDYIADVVLPRVRVGKQQFKFMTYPSAQFFARTDSRVGRRSRPNQIELEGAEVTDSTEDFALDDSVPNADIENADERYNPMDDAVMALQEQIALDREYRVATVVQDAANYASGLSTVLAGSSQFNDPASDPIGIIMDALDAPLMRPNQMVMGRPAWTKFRVHPKVVAAVKGTGVKDGVASMDGIKELFELREINIGSARANSAKPGQNAALTRLWGKHISLLFKNPVPSAARAVTFGLSFQWGDRVAGQWEDKHVGMRGGMVVRTGESLKERVVADQAGYLIRNAVA